ncbi:MAG: YbaY family lipoprotein [Rhodothermales bacterium]
MTSRHVMLLLFVTIDFLALGGCARQPIEQGASTMTNTDSAAVTGTVLYRERVALAPDAVVRVRLEEVDHANSSAVAEETIRPDGRQVPLPFSLAYDPTDIEADARYEVRAEIRGSDGAKRWTTDVPFPVLTQDAPSEEVEVILQRVLPFEGMPPLPTGRTLLYGCDVPGSGGEAFTFTVRPGPGEVGINLPERLGNRSLVLPQVRAASGSKFEGEGVLFWVSGERIRLDVDEQTFGPCAERPQPLDREGAQDEAAQDGNTQEQDVLFRAVGQEPGWTLEIVSDRWMHFTYDYGEREVFTPVPEAEETSERTTYHAVTEAHDLRVVIEDEACTDVMSGEAFETSVTVTLDGEAYRGCGRTSM